MGVNPIILFALGKRRRFNDVAEGVSEYVTSFITA